MSVKPRMVESGSRQGVVRTNRIRNHGIHEIHRKSTIAKSFIELTLGNRLPSFLRRSFRVFRVFRGKKAAILLLEF